MKCDVEFDVTLEKVTDGSCDVRRELGLSCVFEV
jgi:hypothetical protein